jgi:ATP-dependent Lon protease
MLKHTHLFESIPEGYLKGAFLDRIHLYVPGWEVKILKKSMFSTGYGFIVDYLAEILKAMRKDDYSNILDEHIVLDGSLSARDKTGIQKTFSGLVKLLYPDKNITHDEVLELLNFAMEGRKRVKDQLYIIDETFRNEPAEFRYKIKASGSSVAPETLEKLNYSTAVTNNEEENEKIKKEAGESKITLEPKQVVIQDNQTGISYKNLFAAYLKGANKIVLQDPYIRMPYQFKNILEFCVMLAQNKLPEDEIDLHVITWNLRDRIPDSETSFQELIPSVAELGIHITYEYKNLHDRNITADNGWRVTLGRGLDIFEPYDGRFDPGEYDQERRRCKNCEITYLRV